MQVEEFKIGELVIIPQCVLMKKSSKEDTVQVKTASEPLLALYLKNHDYLSDVLVNNEVWTVETNALNKGDKNAYKNDRSF